MGMEIIVKGVFWSIAACGEKGEFHFCHKYSGVTFLREDCIEIKNKEWKAGEKPEEKSLRSTLTYFKGAYIFKKDNDFSIKCGEFYCNAVVF